MNKRRIAAGETLALAPSAIQRDADGFYFMVGGPPVPKNIRHPSSPDVAIVYVRGSLEHHVESVSDNYEAILCRMQDAASGKDAAEAGGEATPPSAVIMCIDSRGGVVSGLNETVAAIRKLRKNSGVPFIAYINELAASAAYAMACSCDEILCPASAIMGSVGTISTMCSRSEADKREGLDVRLLTSGARKSDGHPHTPITDAAEAAEQDRVDKLAASFFELASEARGMSPDKFRSLQAAIFLGPDAKKRGLADAVVSLDDLAGALSKGSGKGPAARGNETDRRAALDTTAHGVSSQKAQRGPQRHEANMSVATLALIARAEAALAATSDVAKQAKIQRRLDAFRLTLKAEEGGDDDGDGDGDGDDDSKAEKQAKKAEKAKKAAEAAKHRARAEEYKKKAAESEEEAQKAEADDDEEGDDEEEAEAKAALALLQSETGLTGRAAIGAGAALIGNGKSHGTRLAALEATQIASARAALIASVAKATTKAERAMLADWPLAQVQSFVEVRRKSGLVHVDESTLIVPKSGEPGTEASLAPEAIQMIDDATAAYPARDAADRKAFRETQVKAHLEQQTKATKAALNGSPGRI